MSIDKVQLKQEEVVGSDVVLTDINPITSTPSVMDPSSGSTMQETLDRIWNAINMKLTRVVNSVNDRTGVVVLQPDDVGLGKVDNVSFLEIKQWVLEQLKNAFKNKHLRLFDSSTQAIELKNTNDESLDNTPFYIERFSTDDKRAYIGYYYWDDVSNTLQFTYKPIRTIGSTDGSIVYDESYIEDGTEHDYTGGKIGVKIHPDEDAMYTVDTGNIATSGLRIDHAALKNDIIYVDSLYGEGMQSLNTSDPTSLLSAIQKYAGDPVVIYINDTLVQNETQTSRQFNMNTAWTRRIDVGDVIITNFASRLDDTGGWVFGADSIASRNLVGQQPAIGRVTQIPDSDKNITTYEIRFYTIKPYIGGNTGFGMTYYPTHQMTNGVNTSQLGIKVLEASDLYDTSTLFNYSGLQAVLNITPNTTDPSVPKTSASSTITTPWGIEVSRQNGLRVAGDISLASFPTHKLQPGGDAKYVDDKGVERYFGSEYVMNYAYQHELVTTTEVGQAITPKSPLSGYASSSTNLMVNLQKMAMPHSLQVHAPYLFMNISGLSIPYYNYTLQYGRLKSLGIYDNKDAVGNEIDSDTLAVLGVGSPRNPAPVNSGGLGINVGKFLEIRPLLTSKSSDYYNGGKLQVRIGDGLEEAISYAAVAVAPDSKQWELEYDLYYTRRHGETTYTPIPYKYELVETEPDDWSESYMNYFTKTDDDQYVQIKHSWFAEPPTFSDAEVYARTGMYTFAEIIDEFGLVFKRNETNRIQLKLDPKTMSFDDNGNVSVVTSILDFTADTRYTPKQLIYADGRVYVVLSTFNSEDYPTIPDCLANNLIMDISGSGGGNDSIPLRFIDKIGQYYDYNGTSDSSMSTSNLIKHNVIKIGDGLKMSGGTLQPDLMVIPSVVKEQANAILEAWSFTEYTSYGKIVGFISGTPEEIEAQVNAITLANVISVKSGQIQTPPHTDAEWLEIYENLKLAIAMSDEMALPNSLTYLNASVFNMCTRCVNLLKQVPTSVSSGDDLTTIRAKMVEKFPALSDYTVTQIFASDTYVIVQEKIPIIDYYWIFVNITYYLENGVFPDD